jgi:hypothetical protein
MERRRREAGHAPTGPRGNVPDLSPSVTRAAQVERRLGVGFTSSGRLIAVTQAALAAGRCPSCLNDGFEESGVDTGTRRVARSTTGTGHRPRPALVSHSFGSGRSRPSAGSTQWAPGAGSALSLAGSKEPGFANVPVLSGNPTTDPSDPPCGPPPGHLSDGLVRSRRVIDWSAQPGRTWTVECEARTSYEQTITRRASARSCCAALSCLSASRLVGPETSTQAA